MATLVAMRAWRPFLLVCVVVITAAAPLCAIERDFKRTFPLQPGGLVKIDTYRGSVVVTESDEPDVEVVGLVEIGVENEAEADRIREALAIEVTADERQVSIRARNPRETRVRFVWQDKYQIDLAWRVRVPRRCDVEVTTVSGGITIGNVTGRVRARSETGAIFVKRIEGSVDAATEVGDVIVSRCSGPVKARVLRGTIRVGTIGGGSDLKNSTGDIDVLHARGTLVAAADAGDVKVGFPRDFSGDAKITTSGGGIFAKIDPTVACSIKASSVWGRVESLLPMTIESGADGQRKLAGRIGNGTSTLTLHANGGHVKLLPGETYFVENDDPVGPVSDGESLFQRRKK